MLCLLRNSVRFGVRDAMRLFLVNLGSSLSLTLIQPLLPLSIPIRFHPLLPSYIIFLSIFPSPFSKLFYYILFIVILLQL